MFYFPIRNLQRHEHMQVAGSKGRELAGSYGFSVPHSVHSQRGELGAACSRVLCEALQTAQAVCLRSVEGVVKADSVIASSRSKIKEGNRATEVPQGRKRTKNRWGGCCGCGLEPQ